MAVAAVAAVLVSVSVSVSVLVSVSVSVLGVVAVVVAAAVRTAHPMSHCEVHPYPLLPSIPIVVLRGGMGSRTHATGFEGSNWVCLPTSSGRE